MKELICPYCKKEIDLNKKLTWFQKWKDKQVHKLLKEQGFNDDIVKHKDYFCDCKAHLTIIKNNKGKDIIISGSK